MDRETHRAKLRALSETAAAENAQKKQSDEQIRLGKEKFIADFTALIDATIRPFMEDAIAEAPDAKLAIHYDPQWPSIQLFVEGSPGNSLLFKAFADARTIKVGIAGKDQGTHQLPISAGLVSEVIRNYLKPVLKSAQ